MNALLLPALQDRRPWLERFTRREYGRAFQEYRNRYGWLYRRAVMDAGGDIAGLAGEILDALEDGWRREPFWRRSVRRFEEQRMAVVYLSPMLMEEGEEAFARALRDAWAARYPKDAYRIATWQNLRDSFRDAIFGIELSPRRADEENMR